jgi:Carboxypeptidase regulatory-like domain/TonB dependent receptor/TonB-dependent Receptor Plug Domain
MKKLSVLFFPLILSLCFGTAASAQTNRGRISGEVTDSSGAAIVNARITIENLGTHVLRELSTNDNGTYVAPDIEPGFYSVKAEAPNFKSVLRERIQVEVGNDITLNFQLQPGAVTETMTVTAEAPLTETSNAVLNGVLANKAINELPLQGRDFQNLLALHPGVQRDPGGGFHTVTSNGLRPDDNNYIIDGANDNDIYYGETVVNDAGISGTPASTLPLDAIQEFNTQEQPQADYGQKPGVVVNIGIKSGTDQLHGTAYYFNRNSAYDARNYFNPSPEPFSALNLHQFGASIGGPILKDKLFYFANYEGVRSKVGNPLNVDTPVTSSLIGRVDPTVIDPTEYSIVDAANAAGCGITPLPTTCNALSLSLVKYFPINPGLTLSSSDPALISTDFNNTNRADNLVFKMDYHPNEKNVISGRLVYANSDQVEEDTIAVAPQWLSQAKPITMVIGADWAWVPNSRITNDVRFSYNSFYEKIQPVDANVNPINYGLNTGVTDPRLFGFPSIYESTSDFDPLGGNSSWPLWTTPSHTQNISDTMTYTRGKHSFKFGGLYSWGAVDYLRATEGRGEVDFQSLQDYVAGNVRSWYLQYGNPARDVSLKSFALFAQDDYRITRKVTLNLGLRYDVTFPIKDANNLLANFSPSQGLVQVGQGISQPYPTNYNNVSPRLGVAWDIFGTGKTVLRAGFGMIYIQPSIRTFMFSGGGLNLNPSGLNKVIDNTDGSQTTIPGVGNLTSVYVNGGSADQVNWNTTGPAIFPGLSNTGVNTCSTDLPCNVFAVDPNLKTPYVLNWNLNLQQQLTPSTVLQVAYVANHGVRLYSITDPNQADPSLVVQSPLYTPGDFNLTNVAAEQLARPYTTNCPTSVLGGLGKGGPCYPYLGFFNYLSNQSGSNYNGLQITLTKRYSKGLYLLAGYTYAHAIDTAGETSNLADVPQNSLDYAAEKGSSDYDIRHRFTFSATYEIPSVKSFAQMLEGWQITSLVTLQGGYPVEFYDSGNDFTATGEGELNAGNDRWNILGPASAVKFSKSGNPFPLLDPSSSQCQLAVHGDPGLETSLEANGGCFDINGTILYPNAPGTFGNMGRNIFQGFGFYDWDASVGKVWKLNERFRLQFRGEVFNVLNHPLMSTSSIKKNLYSSAFGEVRGTPDVWASNPVIGSGGSRHIQLGLKVIW